MERPSRSAGVRSSRKMQSHTLRSFGILFTIALVTISSPASGFTIRRIESLGQTSDLEKGESSVLEVRYDLQTSKSSTHRAVSSLNEYTGTGTTMALTHMVPIMVTNKSKLPILNTIRRYKDSNPLTPQTTTSDHATTDTKLTVQSHSENFTLLTTAKTWSQHNNENELTTTETTLEGLQTITIEMPEFNNSRINSTTENSIINAFTQSVTYNDSQFMTTHNINNVTSEENSPITYSSASINNITNQTEALQSTHEATTLSLELFNQSVDNIDHETTSNDLVSENTINFKSSFLITESPTVAEESFKVTMVDFTTDSGEPYLEKNNSTTTEVQIKEVFTSNTEKDEPATSTFTTWIPYKTTENEPTSPIPSIIDINMTRAESGRLVLEKVLFNTPIPSIIELKNNFLNITQTKDTKRTNETEINVSSSPELEIPTVRNGSKDMESQTEKHETVSSRRGGYLVNTETTTSKPEEATTVQYINNDNANDTFGSMYETDGGEGEVIDALETKNATGLESQSQLAEDAIKEELLMEKTLHENEYMKETARQIGARPVLSKTTPATDVTPTIQEIITEDVLSVKPINEKKKPTVLYSVSPNYKPLKKLDIQPPKQFNRNPDDNSWRNERISSLGIVFKARNASKSFTEVLKNKTTELSNMSEKNEKNDIPDLRERLEKITDVRKSKKKKINEFGDTVYSDYDESPIDNTSTYYSSKEELTSPMSPLEKSNVYSTPRIPPLLSTTHSDTIANFIQKDNFKMFKDEFSTPPTPSKSKLFIFGQYYDSADDYADYVTKIDLKKFSTPVTPNNFRPRSPDYFLTTKKSIPMTNVPDRQPTVQYFPPINKVNTIFNPKLTQKVNIDEYDDQFKNKINQFTHTHPSKESYDSSFATVSSAHTNKFDHLRVDPRKQTMKPHNTRSYNTANLNKNFYLTSQPRVPQMEGGFIPSDGNLDKASYVIKHYKDFIVDAAKDSEDDQLPFTVAPIAHVKINNINQLAAQRLPKRDEYYDYNTQFRQDIVNRFVNNFNQKIDKLKVNFPIIYNNSVVHRAVNNNGKVLSSSNTFVKRLYDTGSPRPNFFANVKQCDVNCESMRVVELSPAYELHYYVPDQEEMEPRQSAMPYRYRL